MTQYKFREKKTGKILDEEELAILLYREGEHIVNCDIEGVIRKGSDIYLLDECGNYVEIDQTRFEVVK